MLTLNDALRTLALLLTAVSLAGGLAHLLELPHKIRMDRQTYFIVRRMYRGWAFLGVAVLGALVSRLVLLARVGRVQLAVNAGLYFIALQALVLATVVAHQPSS
jgi:hypothetical protein